MHIQIKQALFDLTLKKQFYEFPELGYIANLIT